jgi:hypothetical protein
MSAGEEKQTALVPIETTALTKTGAKALVARGQTDLRIREDAEEWLRKGLELQEAAPPDPWWGRGPLNPYAIRLTLAEKLETTIPAYIQQVLAGTLPDVAAKNLGMTPGDQEMAHVAHFFMPDTLERVVYGPTRRKEAGNFDLSAVSSKTPIIPSPAGMDDRILTQNTMEKVAEIALELEKLVQNEVGKLEQLKRRESALKEAFQCFEKGHQLDPTSPELLYWLARSYHCGHGVLRDQEKAIALYRRSAEMGYAEAQSSLAVCLPNDDEEATKWYIAAAEQGEEEALCVVVQMYQDGDGVKQDHAEAARLLRKAAARGVEYAREELRDSAEFYGYPYSDDDGEAR